MKRAIHAFLQHLGRERNASAHTVRAYGQDLEQFAEHAREDLGRQGRPADVDHLLIRSFLARLHARGIKKASAARKLAVSAPSSATFAARVFWIETRPARSCPPRRSVASLAILTKARWPASSTCQEGPRRPSETERSWSSSTPQESAARSWWAWTWRISIGTGARQEFWVKAKKRGSCRLGSQPQRLSWPI